MKNGLFEIIHHGGRHQVTGSCHELLIDGQHSLLIDCGLSQGEGRSELEIDFPIDKIRALVLSHVHIDHCGRLPHLLAAGFRGAVLCSEPSAQLLPLMLEDALKVGVTRDERLIRAFLKQIKGQLQPLPYGQWHRIDCSEALSPLSIKLQPAGHILGSAFVECRIGRDPGATRVVFSGDLGPPYTPLLSAPKSPYRADLLVLESTYGDRLHQGRKGRRGALKAVLGRALADCGVVLIPAFSIGRTQELLYELEGIIQHSRQETAGGRYNWEDLEIIVDSPLANRYTEVFRSLKPYWDKEARRTAGGGRHPLAFEQLTTIDGHSEHLATIDYLKKHRRPCVVIAASGMCSGGRIVNYLKAFIEEPTTDILFVGYQALGTTGREILDYGPRGGYVRLDGAKYTIRAAVHAPGGYSAHADRDNLLSFIGRMRVKPAEVRLVHGETVARHALAMAIKTRFPAITVVP